MGETVQSVRPEHSLQAGNFQDAESHQEILEAAKKSIENLKSSRDGYLDLREYADDLQAFNHWFEKLKAEHPDHFYNTETPFGSTPSEVHIGRLVSVAEQIFAIEPKEKKPLMTLVSALHGAQPQGKKEPNLGNAIAHLMDEVNADDAAKLLGLIGQAEMLTDTMSSSRQTAQDLRDAKRACDDKTLSHEEIVAKLQAYHTLITEMKEAFPELLPNLKSPLDDFDFDKLKPDSSYFGQNYDHITKELETLIEKCTEVISYVQNKMPTITTRMSSEQKQSLLKFEVFINVMRSLVQFMRALVRNQPVR